MKLEIFIIILYTITIVSSVKILDHFINPVCQDKIEFQVKEIEPCVKFVGTGVHNGDEIICCTCDKNKYKKYQLIK